jgi:hypothetical protein
VEKLRMEVDNAEEIKNDETDINGNDRGRKPAPVESRSAAVPAAVAEAPRLRFHKEHLRLQKI